MSSDFLILWTTVVCTLLGYLSMPRAFCMWYVCRVCLAMLEEASMRYILIVTSLKEYRMFWILSISLMVEVVNKMGRWQKSAKSVVKLHSNVSLKAAFIYFCLKRSLNRIYCLPFSFHSVFIILKMLFKELIDRPALLSSDPPVNPRFAKPKDPSLLPPQPKRQVGTHMGNTWQAHHFSYCWELSVTV